jgi:hypothetical protein
MNSKKLVVELIDVMSDHGIIMLITYKKMEIATIQVKVGMSLELFEFLFVGGLHYSDIEGDNGDAINQYGMFEICKAFECATTCRRGSGGSRSL